MASNFRSTRERVIQALCYEAGGLLVIAPLFSLAADAGMAESYGLIAVLSIAAMTWFGAFNTVYDLIEFRLTGRAASDRPHRWRVAHALAFEATQIIVSCPLIYLLTGLSWLEALVADLALTGAYTAYGYLFYWAFDRLRPVQVEAPRTSPGPAPTLRLDPPVGAD
jgi:uncharacterized membrane protein